MATTPSVVPTAAAAAGTSAGQQFTQYLSMGTQFFQIFQSGKLVKATTAATNGRVPSGTSAAPSNPNTTGVDSTSPITLRDGNGNETTLSPNSDGTYGSQNTLLVRGDTIYHNGQVVGSTNGSSAGSSGGGSGAGGGTSPAGYGGQSSSNIPSINGNSGPTNATVNIDGQTYNLHYANNGNWTNDASSGVPGHVVVTSDGTTYLDGNNVTAQTQNFWQGTNYQGTTLSSNQPIYTMQGGQGTQLYVGDEFKGEVPNGQAAQAVNELRINGGIDPSSYPFPSSTPAPVVLPRPVDGVVPGSRVTVDGQNVNLKYNTDDATFSGTTADGRAVTVYPDAGSHFPGNTYLDDTNTGPAQNFQSSATVDVNGHTYNLSYNPDGSYSTPDGRFTVDGNNGSIWVEHPDGTVTGPTPATNFQPGDIASPATWSNNTVLSGQTLPDGTAIYSTSNVGGSTTLTWNDGDGVQNLTVPDAKFSQAASAVINNGGADVDAAPFWAQPTAWDNLKSSFTTTGGLLAWAGVAGSAFGLWASFSDLFSSHASVGKDIAGLAASSIGMYVSMSHVLTMLGYAGPYGWAVVAVVIAVIAIVAWASRHSDSWEDEQPNANPSDWDKFLPNKNVVMLTTVGTMLMSMGFHVGSIPSPSSPGLQQSTGISAAQLNALRTELNADSGGNIAAGSNLGGQVFVIPSGNSISGGPGSSTTQSGAQYDQALYVTPDANGDGKYTVTMVDLAADSTGHHFAVGPGQVGHTPFFTVNAQGAIVSNPDATTELNAALAMAKVGNNPNTSAGSQQAATWLAACHGNYANCVP